MTLALFILASLSALLGAALLALSQERNWRAVGARAGQRRQSAMRATAWPLLLLTLVLSFARDGRSFGPILGLFLAASASLIVALTLTYRPRLLRPVASLFVSRSGD